MRFFTLTVAALMAAMTVHAAPAAPAQGATSALGSTALAGTASSPLSLSNIQLTQCVTQIVNQNAKTCDPRTLVRGLDSAAFNVLNIVGNTVDGLLVSIDGRILHLDILTELVTKATGILNDKGITITVDAVLQVVVGLVQQCPTGEITSKVLSKISITQVTSVLNLKRDGGVLDPVTGLVATLLGPSGLSLDEVKALVGNTLKGLGVAPIVNNLTATVKLEVCSVLENVNIVQCDQVLAILGKEGSLLCFFISPSILFPIHLSLLLFSTYTIFATSIIKESLVPYKL
ncbi:hypothetical protein BDB00DRAFT_863184 [Zychaea mexicana]|uniref:uncharacterized protein n=1 Tax=Zychaea mexicana TaxID=64656 RepID=UPI0022FDFADA|nr:uncharacterized protein BDB00DRAFT_863184 [Zychaea mexicana]KAI9469321.1 hypothetical protein BDB00DRAFT_863184 [Zychaea mexicana]